MLQVSQLHSTAFIDLFSLVADYFVWQFLVDNAQVISKSLIFSYLFFQLVGEHVHLKRWLALMNTLPELAPFFAKPVTSELSSILFYFS